MECNRLFMERCLQLARKGEGFTKPNPMVGAVIVHNGRIIGEGFHRQFGGAHAEVNAIAAVKQKELLEESTLYVSLEPCAHQGKTPPCVLLIVAKKIPRVVVATVDPNPKVSGKGIEILQQNGVEVTVGVCQEEAIELNKIFFVNQTQKRPYIIFKWAQSSDGFLDRHRSPGDGNSPAILSNKITQSVVHKFRTQVQGIMVGTNTALLDNPQLTARNWFGQNPTRIVLDRTLKIPATTPLLRGPVPTIVFTSSDTLLPANEDHLKYIAIDFTKDICQQICDKLFEEKIYAILIEGGTQLLTTFIEKNMWDEAYIEIANKKLISGVKAPNIEGDIMGSIRYPGSVQFHLKSKITRNFH